MSENHTERPVVAEALVERKRGISALWILPIVAAVAGGWVAYKTFKDAGIDVYITFDSAEGIEEGKTKVMYKGLTGGVVKEIRIDDDLETVTVRAEMIPDARNGLRENSLFWLVKPRVSFTGVSGLDTLVSGNYIAMRPGDGEYSEQFKALPKSPPLDENAAGLHLTLKASELGSIDRGSTVFYREIPVGDVQDYELDSHADGVLIHIHILEEYAHLVRSNSRFWNASGIQLNASLGTGIELEMQSLSSLIAGGIAFFSPKESSELASNGEQFTLYKNFSAAEAGILATVEFANGKGLEENRTKVLYNHMTIGVVKELNYDDKFKSVKAEILFDPDAAKLLRKGSQFWIMRPHISFAGLSDLNRLVSGTYISMQPGEGEAGRYFEGLDEAPPLESVPGLMVKLTADDLGGLDVGSPVLYKNIRIGSVMDYRLDSDGLNVSLTLSIENKYAGLIRENSRFWNSGGIKLQAGVDGIDLHMGSASSFLMGGISLFNSQEALRSKKAKNGAGYALYDSYDNATDSGQLLHDPGQPGLSIKLLAEKLGSIAAGVPLLYKQVPVGEVSGYRLDVDNDMVIIDAFVRAPFDRLVSKRTRFWNASGISITAGLSGVEVESESVQSLLKGGIAFANPDLAAGGESVNNGDEFPVYSDKKYAFHDIITVKLRFPSADSITTSTPVKYLGVDVGRIKSISLSTQNKDIIAEVELFDQAGFLARKGSLFWLVRPQVSLTEAENLDTLVTGAYVAVQPGNGSLQTEFEIQPPPVTQNKLPHGLNLTLVSDQLGSIKKGSGVYYRQIKVGEVVNADLSRDAKNVLIYINIDDAYKALIYEGTRFWNVSGVNFNLGIFSGLTVKTESVETLVSGGIAFATPEDKASQGAQVVRNKVYTLHSDAEDEWQQWRPNITLDAQ